MSYTAVTFTLDEESLFIIRGIPRNRRSYILRAMIKRFPELIPKVEDLEGITLKVPASIQIQGDKICVFDDNSVSVKIETIKEWKKTMSFSAILKELDRILDLKDITYRKDELIDILYEVLIK